VDNILDEVTTLILAGHDTTGHTMAFALSLFTQNPEAEAKALDEINTVFGKSLSPAPKDLSKLPYLTAAVSETNRLYPLGWMIPIMNRLETTIEGYKIPAYTSVALLFAHLYQNEEYYPEPSKFKPERFMAAQSESDEAATAVSFAFSLGAHSCLGKSLALLEIRTVLSLLLKQFRFNFAPGFKPDIVIELTMLPKDGMKMVVSER